MAELPLVRQRSVEQAGAPNTYQNVSYTPDDFGAGFGRALQGVGQEGQQLAMTLKAKADEAKANDALNWTQQAKDELRPWMFDPESGILAQQGGKALGSGGQASVVVEDIQKRYLEKITDPETKEAFQKLWSREAEQAKDQAARHELSQLSTYKLETTKAVQLGAMQDAYNGYNDPAAVEKAINTATLAIRANSSGMSPEMLEVAERDAISSMHLAVISRWASEDPSKGLEYYQLHKDQLHGKDHVTATQFIQPALDQQEAEQIVASHMGHSGKTLTQIWNSLIYAESGGNANAESPAGAAGIAQMMPDTARGIAIQLGRNDVATLSDSEIKAWLKANPTQAVVFGKTYLNDMMKQFNGDIEAALVAYNGGPDNAEAFLRHNAGVPPGQRDYSVPGHPKIKSETEPYVNKILGGYAGTSATIQERSARMTPDNWTLKNFRPEDILAPTEGGRWVDSRAATSLDQVADRMKAQFPGFQIKINEAPDPAGRVTAGRRRGTSDPKDNPHVKNSQHVHGTAFDVQIQGWNDVQKAAFLSQARQAGFSGIGFYGPNGHLHIDMGSPRTWGHMPAWARTAMQVPVGRVPGAPTGQVTAGPQAEFSAPAGRGSFYVGVDTPDQMAFLEMAQAIEDTSVRERVLAIGNTYIAREEAAAKQADAANKTQAWQIVASGGSVKDIPPELVMRLDPSTMNSMRAYETGRETGITTDWQAMSGIMSMTPEQLIATDPYNDYRSRLADSEFERLLTMRKAALDEQRGNPAARKFMAAQRTRADLINSLSVETGWDKDSEEMALFQRRLDERVQAEFENEPTAVELQDLIDKLLISEPSSIWSRLARGAGGGRDRTAFDVSPDEAASFIAAEDWSAVQYDDQVTLMNAYRQYFNQDPDTTVATDIYNRAMQVWLGAAPSGPEEEELAFRNSLEASFAASGITRKLTEPEFEKYYGEWLLTFLGRKQVR